VASALVASDTGLVHAGAALGIPLVTVFGPTPHRVYGYEGARRAVLKAALPCVPCAAAACRLLPHGARDAVPPCLEAIGADDAIAALRRVLAAAPRAEAAP
jgi:ADP-heptose:LPS heptosyltransferase